MKNILIVSKMTGVEVRENRYGEATGVMSRKLGIDIEKEQKSHDYHHKCLENVINLFKKHGTSPGVIRKQNISKSDFDDNNWDLIVGVGGDGTFIDIARYIRNSTPVFGIKSTPSSYGGHFYTHFGNAEEHIERLFQKDYEVIERTRIEGKMFEGKAFDDEFTDVSLNEIYVGDKFATGFSKLTLDDKTGQFESGSSGLVVSTYSGRTGWYDHINVWEDNPREMELVRKAFEDAGLPYREVQCLNAKFKDNETDIGRYKFREAGHQSVESTKNYGILKPGEVITIHSKIFEDGAVIFDGSKPTKFRPRVYELHSGSKVEIKISDKPLHVVKF